jgi:hypothetical protein
MLLFVEIPHEKLLLFLPAVDLSAPLEFDCKIEEVTSDLAGREG